MNLIPGANSASQGLRAEQVRLEVISQNIANARTTKTADGGPYQRQSVRFKAALGDDGFCAYCKGNVIKYLWRAEHKGNADQDYGKADWYMRRLLLHVDE